MKPKKKKIIYESNCSHAVKTANSFGIYISTYCPIKHKHLYGFSGSSDKICENCKDFKERRKK